MEVRFLGQPMDPDQQLAATLAAELSKANCFWVLVAWAQVSGLAALAEAIRDVRARGGTAWAVVGIDGAVATREGLELACELFDPVYVFHDTGTRLFHPKVYCAESESGVFLSVGSSNFTGGGLWRNYEANLVMSLDPSIPADDVVHGSACEFRDAFLKEGMPWRKLDQQLIDQLAEQGALVAPAEEREQSRKAAQAGVEGAARTLFGDPVTGLPSVPRGSPAQRRVSNGGRTKTSEPSSSRAVQRWWKKLNPSDVLRKPETSHQRNYVILNRAGHDIDQKTWFREDLFSTVDWTEQTMHTGNMKEVAEIPFSVFIEDEHLGNFDLRIDHSETRIANQNNSPTYLNWSEMIDVIRETDFREWWLELARLRDATFRLKLSSDEPLDG